LGASALFFLEVPSMPALPQSPDVVVVGAGAAGLAAGRRLMEAGREVVVLEAADHVGGRCITDVESFPIPFDRGGSWLHAATANPLTPIARDLGLSIVEDEHSPRRVSVKGRMLSESEVADYVAYNEKVYEALQAAGEAGTDVAATDFLTDGPYRHCTESVLSWIHSVDASGVSTLDYSRFCKAEGEWLLREGLGTVIARHGAEVPVALSTPVMEIDSSGKTIRIATPDGTLEAEAVIVTVSTGVLGAGQIRFTPELPERKLAAIADLPCGVLNKTALLFDGGLPTDPDDPYSYFPNEGEGMGVRVNYLGSDLSICFTGGSFGIGLEEAGPGTATEFALEGLTAAFGSEVRKRLVKSEETRWWSYPHTRGAYSGARPGRADARFELAEPLDGRLLFAGEATIPEWTATVAGAHLSGIRAAEEALAELG
jgi:monoamine oxidase